MHSTYTSLWRSNFEPKYSLKGYDGHVQKMTCMKILKLKTGKTQMLISREINKFWHIFSMECYAAVNKNELLINMTKWMNLRNIMLCERSQTWKSTYTVWFHFNIRICLCRFKNSQNKSMVIGVRTAIALQWGKNWTEVGRGGTCWDDANVFILIKIKMVHLSKLIKLYT